MIKILSSDQIRKWDQFTIKNEPISSIDLMERASIAFVDEFLKYFKKKQPIRIFCGVGNNGGDGLAIGRILKERGWEIYKYIVGDPKKGTEDFKHNLDRSDLYAVVNNLNDLPGLSNEEIIIDGLFGSGLSRPIEGIHAEVIKYLNQFKAKKVSIDISSGLFSNNPLDKDHVVFRSDLTFSFQIPKLAFFLPGSHSYVGDWKVVDIGLNPNFLDDQKSDHNLTERADLKSVLPKRSRFTHKSEVGKLLIVAGSKGKMGAAVLCTRAAFAVGAGLVNVCAPKCGTDILQVTIPEAMVIEDPNQKWISRIPRTDDTLVIGPGLGTERKTSEALEGCLKSSKRPMLFDADALNILSDNKSLLKYIPEDSVLTPHPGEFRRLVGEWKDDFEKLEKLKKLCKEHKINVVLKGAFSAVCDKEGKIFFNSSGNPAMATAGSGDVLSGVIGGLLSQGLSSIDALKLGVYIHGLAGDLIVENSKRYSLLASEIIERIPEAIQKLTT